MGIPENQLDTWSRQGATASASAIYERIRTALLADVALSSQNFDVFLQGSYRNSTNIRGDSDVDVVVKLKDIFQPDYSQLDEFTKGKVKAGHRDATYTLTDFRRDVSGAIRRAFPNHHITEGGKSIKIPRTANNIPADVVPCLEYRLYRPLQTLLGDATYIEGIWLSDVQRNYAVTSFPRQSYENGVAKHGRTNDWYKPTVRIFKNARGWMEDNGLIQSGMASSHAIECLLYNVPDQQFGQSCRDTFVNVVNWLNAADMRNFVCQNGIQRLFDPGRWTTQNARAFIGALIQMWNQWGQQYARVRI
ncbi:tRNA nucleotidyltransferase (CCA-adding enzyme) [Sulfurifustis variabilis]|uniref:tRNA nucleotidyltransferase (CCA-adding enzyme) n=1 Tax=Sulfurifustis variabilis TaxID=1675686 RepID=A0A1B4VFP3_9GAMM|nr:nucleotidyltransferase [Sulfurifustis variabilis]BAU49567.1 tRNA nucleotidyltransferase (CCA-adding enzyme) [Sulfurifustis variabilis]